MDTNTIPTDVLDDDDGQSAFLASFEDEKPEKKKKVSPSVEEGDASDDAHDATGEDTDTDTATDTGEDDADTDEADDPRVRSRWRPAGLLRPREQPGEPSQH